MTDSVQKPASALQVPQSGDYDPCALAKPCSPFYLYNHDSPRPSMDHKTKPSMQISIQDLEMGDGDLSPTVSSEKLAVQKKTTCNRFQFWSRQRPLRTTPKQKGRIASLPKKQRMMVRVAISLLVIGCMVGIAVGIAVGLKSTVWKSNNQVGTIGT